MGLSSKRELQDSPLGLPTSFSCHEVGGCTTPYDCPIIAHTKLMGFQAASRRGSCGSTDRLCGERRIISRNPGGCTIADFHSGVGDVKSSEPGGFDESIQDDRGGAGSGRRRGISLDDFGAHGSPTLSTFSRGIRKTASFAWGSRSNRTKMSVPPS